MGRATFRLWASGMNRKASPEKIREKAVMLRGSTRLRRKPHINWGDAEAQALHEQERSGGRVTDLQIPFDADQKGTQRGASGIVEPEEHGDEGSPGEGAAEIIGGQGRMSWRSARTVQDTAHIVFRRLLN